MVFNILLLKIISLGNEFHTYFYIVGEKENGGKHFSVTLNYIYELH